MGIGLLTALAGAIDISLIVAGDQSLLSMGPITPEILISLAGLALIAIALHYNFKGAFILGLVFGTIAMWCYDAEDLHSIVSAPMLSFGPFPKSQTDFHWGRIVLLSCELYFLYILTLNGLMRSLSDMGHLTKPDGAIPSGRWVYIICGAISVLSGLVGGAPVLISPESAAGIKAGSKTGLSTCVCGALFGLTAFIGPLFRAVPHAATAPLLIMIGVLLFQNVQRIDWTEIRFGVPAFCCLFFIPFTYDLSRGVYIAAVVYILIGMFTGDFWRDAHRFFRSYNMCFEDCSGNFLDWMQRFGKENTLHAEESIAGREVTFSALVDTQIGKQRFHHDACDEEQVDNDADIEGSHHHQGSNDTDNYDSTIFKRALITRARSTTEVLRGGASFDINVPSHLHSSLLFLETESGTMTEQPALSSSP